MMASVKAPHISILKNISLEDASNQCDKDKHTNRKMGRGHKKATHRKINTSGQ